INKLHLQRELKLDVSDEPLIGIVSRLAEQKGIDLICNGLDQIINSGFKVILLGTGDERYHRILEEKLAQYPDRLSINLKFDEILAHRIYAGADFFLMPSRYEPCGLGQMIALTYGTIPVVRKTGGLADSVFEFEPAKGKGNGFLFEIYNVDAMIQTLLKAREVYNNKNHWNQLVLNAMSCDFSWDRTAREYLSLYEKILTDSLAAS
ncbi:MAG: glycosyltransferase, partial [candidate division WOR-3 bacterium]